ncbi:MAG: Fic family protein [Chitinophagales bacterium]|nr:Fic family protein [Chitinophagales bacterium]
MQTTLDKINQLAKTLSDMQPIKPEWQAKLDKKFRLEFNYNSNHMEGNTLTYSETELLLIFDETKGSHTLREYEEMKAHDVALRMVKEWAADTERPLTESNIKNLNEAILVKPFWKDAITPDGQKTRRLIKVGDYKEFPNSVLLSNGEIFEYASVADTPILMHELMDWYRAEEKTLHPATLAAMFHYKFVRIHPFDDGNGRIARLLMNYVLYKNNLPPVIIKSEDKANYLRALRSADIGDNEPLIEYICQQLVWSLEISIKAATDGEVEEAGDLDKELAVLQRELKGEDVLKAKATAENIADAIEQNIIPYFKLLEEKCNGLREFFFDTNRRIEFETSGESGTKQLGSAESQWNTMIENWLNKQIRSQQKKITHMRYNYELKGFKKTVAGQSFWVNAEVWFNDYNYTLQTHPNRSTQVQVPYGKKFTQAELQEMAAPMLKDLIENIKRSNGNN